MPGETNLAALLRSMRPTLHQEEFVFCTVTSASASGVDAIGTFRESEGITIVCRRAEAEHKDLPCTFPCRLITLNVHSSLEAVGFLAAISTALASRGISVNVISAYYHDHLFVPAGRAAEAMEILAGIAAES